MVFPNHPSAVQSGCPAVIPGPRPTAIPVPRPLAIPGPRPSTILGFRSSFIQGPRPLADLEPRAAVQARSLEIQESDPQVVPVTQKIGFGSPMIGGGSPSTSLKEAENTNDYRALSKNIISPLKAVLAAVHGTEPVQEEDAVHKPSDDPSLINVTKESGVPLNQGNLNF